MLTMDDMQAIAEVTHYRYTETRELKGDRLIFICKAQPQYQVYTIHERFQRGLICNAITFGAGYEWAALGGSENAYAVLPRADECRDEARKLIACHMLEAEAKVLRKEPNTP